MDITALNAALLDLAQYGRALVKHPWEARSIQGLAPEATRVVVVGTMFAVEVVREGGGQAEKMAMASSGCD